MVECWLCVGCKLNEVTELIMRYGALCDIEEQCNKFGYTLGDKKELINKLHFGLNICHIHGILTNREYDMALKRLNKMVGKCAVRLDEVKE